MKRIFTRSGIEVLPIGMGCWTIGGLWKNLGTPAGWGAVNDDEAVHAIHKSGNQDCTCFDTGPNYGCGHSEQVRGRAVKNQRSSVAITTKFGGKVDAANKEVFIYGGMCGGFPLITRWPCEIDRTNL